METLSADLLISRYCSQEPSGSELVIQAANEFVGVMLTCYPGAVAKLAKDKHLQQAVIKWTGCDRPFEVPAAFADDEPEFAQQHLPTPRSRWQELIINATLNSKPTGIVALQSGKVLHMNDLMPAFVGLPPDEIVVPNVYDLFMRKAAYTPDDPDAFNQRLVSDRVIVGSLTAFRTNGDFGAFVGTYRYELVPMDLGDRWVEMPVRISEYDPFELIKRFS